MVDKLKFNLFGVNVNMQQHGVAFFLLRRARLVMLSDVMNKLRAVVLVSDHDASNHSSAIPQTLSFISHT